MRRATPHFRTDGHTKSGFLSTLSLRRATKCKHLGVGYYSISIHALLAESDLWRQGCPPSQSAFLSTLSLRRATVTVLGIQHRVGISIHALLAESDIDTSKDVIKTANFYPRSPCGERRFCSTPAALQRLISIHALLAESDYLATW